jgi:HAD superfamily phosphoserine phosphatase-like hydrolase
MKTSVIIPTLNEEPTIENVINTVRKYRFVEEIIVVDGHSIDNTRTIAQKAGASVILSTKLGKGASMREGYLVSSGDIIAYIDADIPNYEEQFLEKMLLPIINNEADFVKSTFKRQAGRVTELVAKPLLRILFPDVLQFSQPLSGMIAGKREFLDKVTFEDDYGVDIGILLDMVKIGARIKEVDIGSIENKMKDWQQLSPMANDVSRAILKRAQFVSEYSLSTLQTANIILDQMERAFKDSLKNLKKMIIFDMDNTILQGRYIYEAAEKFQFQQELIDILSNNENSFLITKLIARLLKGLNYAQLLAVVDGIPLVDDTIDVVKDLKKRGYIVGIVSDSYKFAVDHIMQKINADFTIANELEFSNSIATGEVKVLSYFAKTKNSLCSHNFCKSNVMLYLSNKYKIPLKNMIAVGDSEYDICMIKEAGIGVAFCSENKFVNIVADKIITEKSFAPILEFAI